VVFLQDLRRERLLDDPREEEGTAGRWILWMPYPLGNVVIDVV
jgi:hypothetical protein